MSSNFRYNSTVCIDSKRHSHKNLRKTISDIKVILPKRRTTGQHFNSPRLSLATHKLIQASGENDDELWNANLYDEEVNVSKYNSTPRLTKSWFNNDQEEDDLVTDYASGTLRTSQFDRSSQSSVFNYSLASTSSPDFATQLKSCLKKSDDSCAQKTVRLLINDTSGDHIIHESRSEISDSEDEDCLAYYAI